MPPPNHATSTLRAHSSMPRRGARARSTLATHGEGKASSRFARAAPACPGVVY